MQNGALVEWYCAHPVVRQAAAGSFLGCGWRQDRPNTGIVKTSPCRNATKAWDSQGNEQKFCRIAAKHFHTNSEKLNS
eukprot:2576408-Amphidinium_carterae.1